MRDLQWHQATITVLLTSIPSPRHLRPSSPVPAPLVRCLGVLVRRRLARCVCAVGVVPASPAAKAVLSDLFKSSDVIMRAW